MDTGSLGERFTAHHAPNIHLLRFEAVGKRVQGIGAYVLSLHEASSSVIQEFVQRSQPWGRERVPLPRQLRRALWALIPLQLLWAIWLVTVLSGSSPCEGPICTVATLNHHSAILLACGVICLIGLVGLAIPTRGLSRCNGREVAGLSLAATAGGASLLGIAALIIGALIALIVLGAFVLGFSATS
jgi:hypothetical protein